jgi:hypothetical protein
VTRLIAISICVLIFLVCCAEDGTQGLLHARQALPIELQPCLHSPLIVHVCDSHSHTHAMTSVQMCTVINGTSRATLRGLTSKHVLLTFSVPKATLCPWLGDDCGLSLGLQRQESKN